MAIRDILEREQQQVYLAVCIPNGNQRQIPVSFAPFQVVWKCKRAGISLERHTCCHDLPEVLDERRRVKLEMVIPGKIIDIPLADIRIGLIDPDEIEIPV